MTFKGLLEAVSDLTAIAGLACSTVAMGMLKPCATSSDECHTDGYVQTAMALSLSCATLLLQVGVNLMKSKCCELDERTGRNVNLIGSLFGGVSSLSAAIATPNPINIATASVSGLNTTLTVVKSYFWVPPRNDVNQATALLPRYDNT